VNATIDIVRAVGQSWLEEGVVDEGRFLSIVHTHGPEYRAQ
jgi:hypothetical protein